MPAPNLTEQHAQVSLRVRGGTAEGGRMRDAGVWDTADLPEVSTEATKHRSGGMGRQKIFSGLGEADDVSITRPYSDDVDLHNYLYAESFRRSVPAEISYLNLDDDGIAFGRPIVATGKITTANIGKIDSNSTDPRMIELTLTVAEVA